MILDFVLIGHRILLSLPSPESNFLHFFCHSMAICHWGDCLLIPQPCSLKELHSACLARNLVFERFLGSREEKLSQALDKSGQERTSALRSVPDTDNEAWSAVYCWHTQTLWCAMRNLWVLSYVFNLWSSVTWSFLGGTKHSLIAMKTRHVCLFLRMCRIIRSRTTVPVWWRGKGNPE